MQMLNWLARLTSAQRLQLLLSTVGAINSGRRSFALCDSGQNRARRSRASGVLNGWFPSEKICSGYEGV